MMQLYRYSEVLELYYKAKTHMHRTKKVPDFLKDSPYWQREFAPTLRYVGSPDVTVAGCQVVEMEAEYKLYSTLCKRIQVLSKEYDLLTL